jgi:lysophospholipase L1-like esterase
MTPGVMPRHTHPGQAPREPRKKKEVLPMIRLVFLGLRMLLLGDSLLKRLHYYYHKPNARSFQELDSELCRSGQTVDELIRNIYKSQKQWHYDGDTALVLIGSNDMHRVYPRLPRSEWTIYPNDGVTLQLDLDRFKQDYSDLFQALGTCYFKKIIFLSIPFIPRYEKVPGFRNFHRACNDFVRSLVPTRTNVQYIEIGDFFMHYNNKQPIFSHFCQWIGRGNDRVSLTMTSAEREVWRYLNNPKKDLIHWNKAGMDLVLDRLYHYLMKREMPLYHHANIKSAEKSLRLQRLYNKS